LLSGSRALFNSHYAPPAHNLLQKVSRFPDAMGSASLDEAPHPIRHRLGSDVSPFSGEVDDRAVALTDLDVFLPQ
jgi:hypothetical protein